MKTLLALFQVFLVTQCASLSRSDAILLGSALGGASGAIGGYSLSPNPESQKANALVFGISGLLIGGLIGAIATSKPEHGNSGGDNFADRMNKVSSGSSSSSLSMDDPSLPPAIRKRLSQLVVEEIETPENITDDGTLHEKHKAFRIKRFPEFILNPQLDNSKKGEIK